MKKLLLLLTVILFSCSADSEEADTNNEEMCCGVPVSEVIQSYHDMYGEILEQDLSEEQKALIQAEYDYKVEHPCEGCQY